MQALWGYEGINGKLVEGNTAHIFARPKIIQLGKFGAGYSGLATILALSIPPRGPFCVSDSVVRVFDDG